MSTVSLLTHNHAILADENIPRSIVRGLQAVGCDVCYSKKAITDKEVILHAVKQKRLLLTYDKDFSNTQMYPPKKYFGIVVVAIHPQETQVHLQKIISLLSTYSPKQYRAKTIILEYQHVFVKE